VVKQQFEFLDFKIKDKNLKIKFIKNPKRKFIANAWGLGFFGLGYIQVDELFFNEFTRAEQLSIIYHELWHYENNLRYEICNILFSKRFYFIFSLNKLGKIWEIEADKYSAQMNGKKNLLSVLKKISNLDKKEILKYNHADHPSIKERIKAIKKLK
jgi:hypothetical protein